MVNYFNGLYIDDSGDKYWYKNSFLHNENGPAVEWTDGTKLWYINGKLHRLDGPAVEYPIEYSNENKYWYYESKKIISEHQQNFKHLTAKTQQAFIIYHKRLVLL